MAQPRILVAGSFMMDLIASTPRAPGSGETVIGSAFHTAPGGKGANQAVQCARLGAKTAMAGQVGEDSFGTEMTHTAKAAGVDVRHVTVDPHTASGVGHILLEVKGNTTQNRITVIPGANFTQTVEQFAWLTEEIHNYDLVMMQLEIPTEVDLFIARTAHSAGVPVMLNPAPAAPLPDGLLEHVTYLSPNEHEAALITGVPIRATEDSINEEDLKRAVAVLTGKGVAHVIVTLGANGSILANEDGILRQSRVTMEQVADPTAAGDSFVAAFCTGVCAGLAHADALTFAAHAAAITVSRMGAMPSLPTLEEVKALLRERTPAFDLAKLGGLEGKECSR